MSIKEYNYNKKYKRHVWQTGKETEYSEDIKIFSLSGKDVTYALAALEDGYLAHVYFGKKIEDGDISYLLRLDENPWTPKTNMRDKGTFMDTLQFEYPCFGIGDYREPCLGVMDENGASCCDIRYKSHRIYAGKPKLEGLPALFAEESEASTLEITCEDAILGLEAVLIYTVYDNYNAIIRSVKIINNREAQINLTRVLSFCVDFDTDAFDIITLNGSWARERITERSRIRTGKQGISSERGTSSHQNNPFFALVSHNADEDTGEAYGFNFVYSGNFFAQAEVTQHKKTRALMGINPLGFNWALDKGETFTAPEAVMVYSSEGIGSMSRTFHDLYRNHLIRGEYKNKPRPVLINSWEAAYFDFDADRLLKLACEASALGIETLVIDDGWFGKRNSDNSSLGDWRVNEEKLKGGLKFLADEVNKLGMKLGLWFEPEMVSPDSDLYRKRPDWAISVKGREGTLSREQFVLDFSNQEVTDYIYGMMKAVLDSANIEYIKWDMNRQLTEAGSSFLPAERQREIYHRYVLGVYGMMERLVSDYPHILLENCSGGGGRFDPGMLYYSPQIWCSDNTDAYERLAIQRGTSICYPPSAIGAHVSICPNHITGRSAPFETRARAAMFGTFGYELDTAKLSSEEKRLIPSQIAEYKKYARLVQTGDLFRLGNEAEGYDAWAFVSKDKTECLFTAVQGLSRPNFRSRRIKLSGLDRNALYENDSTGEILSGGCLMNAGINVLLQGDFASELIYFNVSRK